MFASVTPRPCAVAESVGGADYIDLRAFLESRRNLFSLFPGASQSFQGSSKESAHSESQVILLIPKGSMFPCYANKTQSLSAGTDNGLFE